jgi:hypothetical protein
VFVSALLSPGSKPRMAVNRAQRDGAIVLSYAVLAELFEVLEPVDPAQWPVDRRQSLPGRDNDGMESERGGRKCEKQNLDSG